MVTDIEKKLAEYRTKKAKLLPSEKVEPLPSKTQCEIEDKIHEKDEKEKLITPEINSTEPENQEEITESPAPNPTTELSFFTKYSRQINISITVLKFLLWSSLMLFFVEVEFGAIFFVCSMFYVIYANLRTEPKKKGEISAYSVFNPNCEAIDGTLTAEQFERELKFGPKSVH